MLKSPPKSTQLTLNALGLPFALGRVVEIGYGAAFPVQGLPVHLVDREITSQISPQGIPRGANVAEGQIEERFDHRNDRRRGPWRVPVPRQLASGRVPFGSGFDRNALENRNLERSERVFGNCDRKRKIADCQRGYPQTLCARAHPSVRDHLLPDQNI